MKWDLSRHDAITIQMLLSDEIKRQESDAREFEAKRREHPGMEFPIEQSMYEVTLDLIDDYKRLYRNVVEQIRRSCR